MSARWNDCDGLDDPMQRIECRTSKLNDGFHALEGRIARIEWKLAVVIAGSVTAGLGGLMKVLEGGRALGWW